MVESGLRCEKIEMRAHKFENMYTHMHPPPSYLYYFICKWGMWVLLSNNGRVIYGEKWHRNIT